MIDRAKNYTLIPFGLNTESNTIVDVHDVQKGKACGCICPSCHTTLIAKQGDINEWHFAHLSNKESIDTVENICEYSFYTSVRLMALQLIGQQFCIKLPAYKSVVKKQYNEIYISEDFTITKTQSITLDDIKVNQTVLDNKVDIIGKVKNYSFMVLFDYPERVVPLNLKNLNDNKCGIISLSLEPVRRLFEDAKERNKNYRDILYNFLQTDLKSKTWIYHPGYKKVESQAIQRLEEKKQNYIKNYKPDIANIISSYNITERINSPELIMYKCTECGNQWEGLKNKTTCPKCNNHLYTFEVKNLQNN